MERLLSLAAAGALDQHWQTNLGWFRRFMLLHTALRTFLSLQPVERSPWEQLQLVVAAALVALAFAPRTTRWATHIAAALVLAQVVIPGSLTSFPLTANHVGLELLILGFLALLDDTETREAELLLPSLRWLIATLLFYSGLQKLLFGSYFDGQFLAYLTATEERFALFFQHLMPAEELERLVSYREALFAPGKYFPLPGSGPFRVDSVLFRLVSNLVWVVEIAAGVLLLLAPTRRLAAIGAMLFVVCIELGAREITFGVLMISLLLLFLPGAWNRRSFPALVLLYVWLAAHQLGWVPMIGYAAP